MCYLYDTVERVSSQNVEELFWKKKSWRKKGSPTFREGPHRARVGFFGRGPRLRRGPVETLLVPQSRLGDKSLGI